MTCHDCNRIRPSAQLSLEFGAVICDACYGSRLAVEKESRERTVSANTRTHFEAIRAAQEINRPTPLGVRS